MALQSPTSTIDRAALSVPPSLTGELAAIVVGLDVARCFHCGVCSGSCPTVTRMQYGPRRIIHMLQLGLTEPVLRSRDIWLCVSCYSCSVRCPQGVAIADAMAALRRASLARGFAKDSEAAFSRAFVQVVLRGGRLFEPELLFRFYSSQAAVASLLKQAGLGLRLLAKGKISLRPDRLADPQGLHDLAARLRKAAEARNET
jgi:heterodisulfide reductase subunit C